MRLYFIRICGWRISSSSGTLWAGRCRILRFVRKMVRGGRRFSLIRRLGSLFFFMEFSVVKVGVEGRIWSWREFKE